MPFGQPESDYEIFDAFVRKHMADFGKFAYYVVRNYDYAHDGVQSALEAIMKYYDGVRDFDEQRLYRYSLSVIKNECIRAAKEGQKIVSTDEFEITESVPDDMLDNIIRDVNNELLRQCIDQLPEKFKQAILMKYYYHRTDREIGQTIGVTDSSVRMILTRARQKLKKLYVEAIGEEVTL